MCVCVLEERCGREEPGEEREGQGGEEGISSR